mmetsp:Transcript_1603/g.1937  ORF Transcript_1603/g.1937 Transcript_1603/m.1937 type:complete len:195 (+) Transcript_1603:251-835(+)
MGKVKAVNNFGLDAEIAERRNANYPQAEEEEATAWIEQLLGITFDKDFGEMLKDGVILCQVMNVVVPGKIKKIYEGTMVFKQRENISNFIRACRELGVPEGDLFTTEALFELKDVGTVVLGLFAFSRAFQNNPSVSFSGPILGPKVGAKGEAGEYVSNPNATISPLNSGSSATMEKTEYSNSRDQIIRETMDDM